MRKKYFAAAMSFLLSASIAFAGCGTAGSSSASVSAASVSASSAAASSVSEEADSTSEASDTIYGEVASVDGNTITLNVGTKSDDSSELTLTGETKEITVTDNTTYSSDGMGGGQMPSGEAPSGQAPSGDAPSGDAPSGSQGQPPEKPDDSDSQSSSDSQGQSPEKPDDSDSQSSSESTDNTSAGSSDNSDSSQPGGQAGPGGMEISLDSLTEGTEVEITLDSDGNAASVTVLSGSQRGPEGGQGGPGGGQSQADVTYSSENEISSDTTLSDQTIESTGTDEEAVLVDNGATASLSGLTIRRTSDNSTGGDNSSFYGVGASVLTTDGTTYLSDSTITSDAKGGAGVFSYGENSTVYVSDTTITTSQDTSGGIHAAGGGTLYAYDDTVTTAGESSAAIRSDRGGGTMVVDGGSYTSNGTGSPAIYSTADITVHDADLTATNSEATCIEGLNTIRLFDCDLAGNMPDNEQNDCTWNVILYQSMSGDSEVGNSTFEMEGGSLTAKSGGMFYTTNTESTFILDDGDITYADENDFFLKCTGNSNARGWGSTGSNGADCSFTAIDQEMEGDIIWDSISQLDFYMTGNSSLTGAVIGDESNAGDGGSGTCSLYIENGSVWTVTGDSTLTNLYNAGTIQDADGNTVTIKGTDGTVYVEGSSQYTITVSSYSEDADFSGASSIDSWSDYEVAKPSQLS